ncbi:MAG: hypothetical protein HUJ79_05065, partial [Firmicutes bacterium]|nr:hypothetical protein [Bacillota bacterium]
MEEKDYNRLIKEYEKLNKARPDIYKLSYNEQIESLERCLQKYPFTDETKEREIEVLLKWIRNDRSLAKYYKAFCDRDMAYLNDVLYETGHILQLGDVLADDIDHGIFGWRVTPELMAANMFDRLPLLLPYENGLATYNFVTTSIANLLIAIIHEDTGFAKEAKQQAMKELGKKNPEYVKLRIECMMAILDQDPDTFNEKIGPFCKAWMKGQEWGMNAFTKGFCVEAHGMYNLAKWAYGGVMKDQIRMPDEKNFCQDLALWQEEHGCMPGKTRHYFPESIDIYNK